MGQIRCSSKSEFENFLQKSSEIYNRKEYKTGSACRTQYCGEIV
jgi:hypothetical protein